MDVLMEKDAATDWAETADILDDMTRDDAEVLIARMLSIIMSPYGLTGDKLTDE